MISDYIRDAFKKIYREKNCVFTIVFNGFLVLILVINIIFILNFKNYFGMIILKNIGFRSVLTSNLDLSVDEGIEKVKQINHVVEAYESRLMTFSAESNLDFNGLDGSIEFLYGTEKIVPKSIAGKSIKDIKTGETICPYNFYPDSGIYDFHIDSEKMLSEEVLLNKVFEVSYISRAIKNNSVVNLGRKIKNFKIVGLYDSKAVMNLNNQCYITPEDMNELHENMNPIFENDDRTASLVVVIDDVVNLDYVVRQLELINFQNIEVSSEVDTILINKVQNLVYSFLLLILCTIILAYKYFIHKKYQNESKSIGIMKSCGYNNADLIKKYFIENFILIFCSFILGFVFFVPIYFYLKYKVLILFSYIGFGINFYLPVLLLIYFVVFLVEMIMNILCLRKKVKLDVSFLVKEGNS